MRVLTIGFTILLSVCMCGCMNFPIEGDCNSSLKTYKETVHCSMYGFNWDDDTRTVRKTTGGLGIAKIEYNMSGLDLLVGAITLGLYVPVEVEYWPEAEASIDRLPKKK